MTAHELEVVFELLLRASVGKRSSNEVGRALLDGQIQALDERGVQCRRIFQVFERFFEAPPGSQQLSTFDLHDAIVASGLQDLRIEHGQPENAADSVTLFS